MTTTIYKFEQGRLLVKESRAVQSDYIGSGVPVRIGQVRAVEEVLSVDTDYSQLGLVTPLNEVRTSGHEIFVVMRRGDQGDPYPLSGLAVSGSAALGLLSGLTSGLAPLGEVASGGTMSGLITVTANVIGY